MIFLKRWKCVEINIYFIDKSDLLLSLLFPMFFYLFINIVVDNSMIF